MAEMAVELDRVEVDDLEQRPHVSRRLRVWSGLWPKLVAIALALGLWQVVVWAGWQPDYVLPGPGAVFKRLAQDLGTANFDLGVAVTLRRALFGYAIAVAIGSLIGILVARVLVLRKAIGAAILGLQSMPSFVGGLKQGWAFAWRSLMAGEIIGIVGHQFSIGQQIQFARDFADSEQLLAIMVVIFVIGIAVDSIFGVLDTAIRRRWGLLGSEA